MDPTIILQLLASGFGANQASGILDNAKLKGQKFPKATGKAKLGVIAQAFPEMMEGLRISKKDAKSQGLGKFETAKIGNQLYRVPDSAEFESLVGQVEDQQFERVESTRQKLLQQPLFRTIMKRASGDLSDVEQFTADAFGDLAQRSVGAAAAKGTLTTPGAVNRALGPLALQKAQYLQGLQDTAQRQAIAASTQAPGAATSIYGAPTLGGTSAMLGSIAQQNMGIGQFNAGISSAQAGLYGGAASGAGGLMGSLFG